VDAIIQNKNLSNLEKNYQLKNCYMLRDKRLRETLDDDQYKKWLRIKDADEYLVLTKDSELKDGVNK
jgi:GTP-binding protein EngB required for normal cell division